MAQTANLVPYSSYRGPLYLLVCKALPDFRNEEGDLRVRDLANAMSLSHEGVYKWFRANKIPPARAKQIIELSGGRLPFSKFHDFL